MEITKERLENAEFNESISSKFFYKDIPNTNMGLIVDMKKQRIGLFYRPLEWGDYVVLRVQYSTEGLSGFWVGNTGKELHFEPTKENAEVTEEEPKDRAYQEVYSKIQYQIDGVDQGIDRV